MALLAVLQAPPRALVAASEQAREPTLDQGPRNRQTIQFPHRRWWRHSRGRSCRPVGAGACRRPPSTARCAEPAVADAPAEQHFGDATIAMRPPNWARPAVDDHQGLPSGSAHWHLGSGRIALPIVAVSIDARRRAALACRSAPLPAHQADAAIRIPSAQGTSSQYRQTVRPQGLSWPPPHLLQDVSERCSVGSSAPGMQAAVARSAQQQCPRPVPALRERGTVLRA
jgi:hypothetical protein